MSVYDIIKIILYHTQPILDTTAEKVEHPPHPTSKGIEWEINFSLTLSSIHPEIELETH